MKRSFAVLAMAFCVALTGCSGVSQEDYDELLERNIILEQQIHEFDNEMKELETENAEQREKLAELEEEYAEYRMPKAHVKRVVDALTCDRVTDTQTIGTVSIEQYNIEADIVISIYDGDKLIKISTVIKTENSVQELAAFAVYYAKIGLGEYVDKEIENGCENFVMTIADKNGDNYAVWLAYKNSSEITHDMNIVDTDVLKAVDEVLQDVDKWKLKEEVKFMELNDEDNQTENEELKTQTATDSQPDFILSDDLKSYPAYTTEYGQTWYIGENGAYCVTYIDENSGKDDAEIIAYAYQNIVELLDKYNSNIMMMFEWRDRNHEVVGMTMLVNAFGLMYISDNRIAWSGEYNYFNSHEANNYWIDGFWAKHYPCPEE